MTVASRHAWIIAIVRRLQSLGPGRHMLIIDLVDNDGNWIIDWTVTSLGKPEKQ